MKRLAAASAILSIALLCLVSISASRWQQRPTLPPPTLQILNHGPHDFAIILDGSRIGSSSAGITACIKLRGLNPNGPHYLMLRALASNVAIHAPVVYLTHSRGWRMELGQSPAIEVHSLQPAAACA